MRSVLALFCVADSQLRSDFYCSKFVKMGQEYTSHFLDKKNAEKFSVNNLFFAFFASFSVKTMLQCFG